MVDGALAFLEKAYQSGQDTKPDPKPKNLALSIEDAGLPDLISSFSTDMAKVEAITTMLNSFIIARQEVTGSPLWTSTDLRCFSLAVRALMNSWELATFPTPK